MRVIESRSKFHIGDVIKIDEGCYERYLIITSDVKYTDQVYNVVQLNDTDDKWGGYVVWASKKSIEDLIKDLKKQYGKIKKVDAFLKVEE